MTWWDPSRSVRPFLRGDQIDYAAWNRAVLSEREVARAEARRVHATPWGGFPPQIIKILLTGDTSQQAIAKRFTHFVRHNGGSPKDAATLIMGNYDLFYTRTAEWLKGGAELLRVDKEVVYQCSFMDPVDAWDTVLEDGRPLAIQGFPDNVWRQLLAAASEHFSPWLDEEVERRKEASDPDMPPFNPMECRVVMDSLSLRMFDPIFLIHPHHDGIEVIVLAYDASIKDWVSIFSTEERIDAADWETRNLKLLPPSWSDPYRLDDWGRANGDQKGLADVPFLSILEHFLYEVVFDLSEHMIKVAAARYQHENRIIMGDHFVLPGRRRDAKKGRSHRKKTPAAPLRRHRKRVRPISVRLDEELLRTYTVSVKGGVAVNRRPSLEEVVRSQVRAHMVEGHQVRVWVREPGADEAVIATRQRTCRDGSSHTLYCVRRKRRGHMRGSGLLAPKVVQVVPERRVLESAIGSAMAPSGEQ